VFTSDHPSPFVRARFPNRWNAIPVKWAEVLSVISDEQQASASAVVKL